MINRNKFKIAALICVGIVLLIGVFAIFNSIKDKHIKEEIETRVEKEMELKQAKKEFAVRELYIDSLKGELATTKAVIEYQKKYPQVIIKKYEQAKNRVDSLTFTESYKLLTNNIGEYKINSKRYDISRFK